MVPVSWVAFFSRNCFLKPSSVFCIMLPYGKGLHSLIVWRSISFGLL